MAHFIRSIQWPTPQWSWLGQHAAKSGTRLRAVNDQLEQLVGAGSIGTRFSIEGATSRPGGVLRHHATRRIDDLPVWVLVPEDDHSYELGYAVTFLRTAKLARDLRHPYVLRTHEAGLLDDGRPYAIVQRLPTESMTRWLDRSGPFTWAEVRPIALRLCSAVEAVRERGLAPAQLDLDGCLHVRDGDPADVRLGELFVLSSARPAEHDVPALAAMVSQLLGHARDEGDVGLVLTQALRPAGFGSVAALATALASIEAGGVRESFGANHAAVAGAFEIDVEAEERAEAARPIPRSFADAV